MHREEATEELLQRAEELHEEGAFDRALMLYGQVLAVSPDNIDAHNGIGLIKLYRGAFEDAERDFQVAMRVAEKCTTMDGSHINWIALENRPYLRAVANLAWCLAEQARYREAIELREKLLSLNPNDNQGIRHLVGFDYLMLGDLRKARRAFKRGKDEPGCAFALALTNIALGASATVVGTSLVTAFGQNRYVAPLLLKKRCARLDAFHGSNHADFEWAQDIAHEQRAIWESCLPALPLLHLWWSAPVVVKWRKKLDTCMMRLRKEDPGTVERCATVDEWFELKTPRETAKLVRGVIGPPAKRS